MSGKERTEFGDAIRRSGMPLEFVTSLILEELHLLPKGRYYYTRDGKTNETDVWALGGFNVGPITFEHCLFVECEARDEEKRWCFFPQSDNVVDLSRNAFIDDICILDGSIGLTGFHRFKKEILPSLPVAGDGVEMFVNNKGNWDSNPKSIRNAIRQATMPIGDHLAYPLHRNFILDYEGQQVELYLPVVVTTARIFTLRPDTEWETLKTFEKIDECFEERDGVMSCYPTPSYITRYWRDSILGFLDRLERNYRETYSKKPYFSKLGKSNTEAKLHVAELLTTNMPTRTAIVGLKGLKNILARYLERITIEVSSLFKSEEG